MCMGNTRKRETMPLRVFGGTVNPETVCLRMYWFSGKTELRARACLETHKCTKACAGACLRSVEKRLFWHPKTEVLKPFEAENEGRYRSCVFRENTLHAPARIWRLFRPRNYVPARVCIIRENTKPCVFTGLDAAEPHETPLFCMYGQFGKTRNPGPAGVWRPWVARNHVPAHT